jgi:hypothetical protein
MKWPPGISLDFSEFTHYKININFCAFFILLWSGRRCAVWKIPEKSIWLISNEGDIIFL